MITYEMKTFTKYWKYQSLMSPLSYTEIIDMRKYWEFQTINYLRDSTTDQ
jgi:hypothetical protein